MLAGEPASTIFSFKSATFKKSGLDEASLTNELLLELLAGEPRYFRRPLVVLNGRLLAGANAKKLGAELGF